MCCSGLRLGVCMCVCGGRLYVHTYVCVCNILRLSLSVCWLLCVRSVRMYVYIHMYVHVLVPILMWQYVRMYVCMYVRKC